MPTGYTAPLYEGKDISFEEFALGCARAFGALVMMRDDPTDAPIPDEFEPSNYYAQDLAAARERLAEVRAWTLKDARAALAKENAAIAAGNLERAEKEAALLIRYEAMLAQAKAWEPPTPEHQGLKAFMVEQLESSIRFDTGPFTMPLRPNDPWAYRDEEIAAAEKRITRSEQEDTKERKRAAERTRWIRDLRDSLTGAAVT